MKNELNFNFPEPLIEGVIQSRPNRFIMFVKIGNKTVKTHCPSTGRIGNITFKNIPCLLSISNNPKRKTQHTVEAISLDPVSRKNKKWIGINQVRTNAVVEYFIRAGLLNKLFNSRNLSIKREVTLGNSRIDFLVNKTYLEVKTPLNIMPVSRLSPKKEVLFNSFERIIKHFGDLSESLTGSRRAVLAMCYFYDAPKFKPPATDKYNSEIKKAAFAARDRGVENWQINFRINKHGVSLSKYFKLSLA